MMHVPQSSGHALEASAPSLTGARAGAASRPQLATSRDAARSRSPGQRASASAHSLEWDSVRATLRGLSTKAMTTAEVGLRLYAVINRAPSLFALVDSSTCEGFGGVGGRVSPDLLPLPLPKFTAMSEEAIDKFFPVVPKGDAGSWENYVVTVGLPGARGAGAQAWAVSDHPCLKFDALEW